MRSVGPRFRWCLDGQHLELYWRKLSPGMLSLNHRAKFAKHPFNTKARDTANGTHALNNKTHIMRTIPGRAGMKTKTENISMNKISHKTNKHC